MKKVIKLRNPLITVKPVNYDMEIQEWCIRTNNIIELFMQDGKCFVIFSTCYYNMKNCGSIVDLCAEITVEEYDEIFEELKGTELC